MTNTTSSKESVKVKATDRVLTGIRASGSLHLGNLLGAMAPALERQGHCETFFFVADLHGLTTTPDRGLLKTYTHQIAASWLAAGLDPERSVIWRQSDIHEHSELAYFLACVTSMGLMERAHSYKDAMAKQQSVRMGLFCYPLLMAADILLYNSDYVPVGEDQQQHLEMTRDIATFFNERYGQTFKLPREIVDKAVSVVPGTDGRKMSKSYGNGIDIFAEESILKKQIMSIKTDSKTLEEPKVAEECLVYTIYSLIAPPDKCQEMKRKLEAGGYGYGDAKKEVLATLLERYGAIRKTYQSWMKSPADIEEVLRKGADKARLTAEATMHEVKSHIGL